MRERKRDTRGVIEKSTCEYDVSSRRTLFGSIIILIGVGLLFHNLVGLSFNYVWPLIIIIVGVHLLLRRSR